MKIFSFIFARGGSKGLPKKNIKKLNGKPLITYAINLSNDLKEIDKTFVSTDSDEIIDVIKNYDVEIIKRPKELATDVSSEWLAWQHAISYSNEKFGEFQKFLSLPATSPLKEANDVKECIKLLDDDTDVVITMSHSTRNPWFNMCKVGKNNYVEIVNKGPDKIVRRQDAPNVYDITTLCYVANPQFVLKNTNIWDGKVKAHQVPKERSIDIDTELDFKIAEFLIREKD